MLTLSDIRKRTMDTLFRKGLDIQNLGYVKEFEYSIYTLNEVTVSDISATVYENADHRYHVELNVDEEYDDISEARCDCEEIFQVEGMCRHCVAVLAEYIQKRKAKEVLDVKWKKETSIQRGYYEQTETELKNMITRYALSETNRHFISEAVRGQVQLIPEFTMFSPHMSSIDFQIGVSQNYVLKNIPVFLDAIEQSEDVRYGKKLEFYHTMDAFTESSVRLIAFLKKRYRQTRTNALGRPVPHGYQHKAFERSLEMDEADMDEFFEIMRGYHLQANLMETEENDWFIEGKEKRPRILLEGSQSGLFLTLESSSILYGQKRYYYYGQGIISFGNEALKSELGEFYEYLMKEEFHKAYVAVNELPAFCKTLLPLLQKHFEVQIIDFEPSAYLPEKPEFELYLDKSAKNVIAGKLMAVYRTGSFNILETNASLDNRNVEEEMIARYAVNVYFNATDLQKTIFLIRDDEDLIYQLMSGGLKKLSELMTIYASDAFSKMKIHNSPTISVGLSLKSNLLELSVQSEEVPMEYLTELLSRYDRKKKYIRLKNGDFLNLQDEDGLDMLAEIKESLHLTDKNFKTGKMMLPAYQCMYLDAAMKNRKYLQIDKDHEFKAMVRNMKTIEDSDYEVPLKLKKIMREYQQNGFRWLRTLQLYGFGGILADDMGLGKTLQVISLLLNEQEQCDREGKVRSNSLIICPASLVYNWKREIETFAPELPVRIIAGSIKEREERIAEIQSGEIIITSYDLLKRDVPCYGDIIFAVQVIDEAQYIKNTATQAAKAVKEITASFKLALTGTPIENRLSELWSIFDYLMPGFLFTYRRFRDEIEIPIMLNHEEQKLHRLQQMIRPFVLRRLKSDVLKDLPDKIEETMVANLQGEQKELYDAHVQSLKQTIEQKTETEFKKEKIQILAELTRLRQICCDPSLLFDHYQGESEKLEVCLELVKNAVEGGHKILIFSQFTTMLGIIQEHLKTLGISYYTLTGSVKKEERMRLVDEFNKNDVSVFCISLKAGGTGLNLTSADIVIHYDPWWNVAVQNQATDRAHRLGQERVVTVYRLVAENTIEERIMEIQKKKQVLAQQILESEGMDTITFSKDDLLALLRN